MCLIWQVHKVALTRHFGRCPGALFVPCAAAGGDAEAEAAALEVCREAEITAIVLDSKPAAPSKNLDSTPKSFLK